MSRIVGPDDFLRLERENKRYQARIEELTTENAQLKEELAALRMIDSGAPTTGDTHPDKHNGKAQR